MVSTPQEFFRIVVEGNYEAWSNSGQTFRRAMNYAVSCIALCDWVATAYHRRLPEEVDKGARQYENRLRRMSDDFALVCDLGNSWKHGKISRNGRRVSLAADTQHSRP
jgi:hypothetical protein